MARFPGLMVAIPIRGITQRRPWASALPVNWAQLSAPTGGWQSNSSTTAVGGPVIEVGIPTRPLIEEKRTTSLTLRPGSGTLVTGDPGFLARLFPVVTRAIDFVLHYQGPDGEIDWAVDQNDRALGDALVTGCSSIYKSLECAILIAEQLDYPTAIWRAARTRLGEALRYRPERFDRTWESKSRYAMDWFYPILAGWVVGAEASKRLAQRWEEFIEPGIGCRCENHQPWVTVAESCELTLALLAAGDRDRAIELFGWLTQWRDTDGGWWTGYQFAEQVLWPLEKPTWTAGAVLLAADALTAHSGASELFLKTALSE